MSLPPIDDLPFVGKKKDTLEYLHRPPVIKPNYGKPQRSLLPKTNMCRVLLYDNHNQKKMLDVRMKSINRDMLRVWRQTELNKSAFTIKQHRREKRHNVQNVRYQAMKEAFIAEYGTQYMPVMEAESNTDPFLAYTKLAPPINILCYYLEMQLRSQEEDKARKDKEREEREDGDGLFGKFTADPLLPHFAHSVDDPRFKSLQQTLIEPADPTDGYLQISPGYFNGKKAPRRRRRSPRGLARIANLPNFYKKALRLSRTSLSENSLETSRRTSLSSVGDESSFNVSKTKTSSLLDLPLI